VPRKPASPPRRNCRADALLELNHEQCGDTDRQDQEAVEQANRASAEQPLHAGNISKGELQDHHEGNTHQNGRRAKQSLPGDRRSVNIADSEQVKDLHHHNCVHHHCPGNFRREAALDRIKEDTEGADHEEQGDKSDAP